MFYSDRPINSGNEDKLNRKGFARLLARTLVNLDSKDTFTVGLFGKWGCGKTSLVNMTLEEIENIQAEDELKKEIIIVHFEPWNFTDTNQLLTQFFIRLANEFQKKGDKSLTKIGKALENYSDAFGLFELLPGVGAPIAAVGKWGFSRLGQKIQKGLDERDVLKQKNQVIQLLSAQSNRVLVVLDDIDRLNNEQIRYIFQLITSVARFPNMTYLLVFDKEIVVEALKDVQSGNGQDYLEKVIQMPIQIPNIQRSDLHNFLFEQLDKIIIDFLLKQEENGTSYEFLEDIKARISELSGSRAKVLICALLKSIKDLNKTVHKSWFSTNAGNYAERMMLDLIEQVPAEERIAFISEFISQSDMGEIQSIAPVIWTGSGTEYEIQNGYDEYFSTERALSAIETCKKNRTILELPEELQHICAAFFLANSGNPECGNHIYQHATEKLISSWRM